MAVDVINDQRLAGIIYNAVIKHAILSFFLLTKINFKQL